MIKTVIKTTEKVAGEVATTTLNAVEEAVVLNSGIKKIHKLKALTLNLKRVKNQRILWNGEVLKFNNQSNSKIIILDGELIRKKR